MASELFPRDFYDKTLENTTGAVPMLYDYLIDLQTGKLILDKATQSTIIVSGLDAIITQVYRKLHTARGRYLIYSKNYGNRLVQLLGISKQTADAFVDQYLNECLVDNKYITRIRDIATTIENGRYTIYFSIETIYGDTTQVYREEGIYLD